MTALDTILSDYDVAEIFRESFLDEARKELSEMRARLSEYDAREDRLFNKSATSFNKATLYLANA